MHLDYFLCQAEIYYPNSKSVVFVESALHKDMYQCYNDTIFITRAQIVYKLYMNTIN